MGGLGSTYTIHLKLIGKRVVDFVLVLIELLSVAVTVEALRANIMEQSHGLFATDKRLTLVSDLAYAATHFDLLSSPHFVADFLQAKCDFTRKTAVLRFGAPIGGLEATYDDHLRLIESA